MSAMVLESTPAGAKAGTQSSGRQLLAGRIITGIVVLFLLFDMTVKLMASPQALEASAKLGFNANQVFSIGLIEVVCLIVYLIPRTAPIGAILWTGYLGGAIVTNLRQGSPLFTHILFPTYVAAFIWGGLYLRDRRVRALLRPTH